MDVGLVQEPYKWGAGFRGAAGKKEKLVGLVGIRATCAGDKVRNCMVINGRETWLVVERRLGIVRRWDWCLECTWGGLERKSK